jgi:hypothetical protein
MGIRTSNLDVAASIDELIGHVDVDGNKKSSRISLDNLSAQMEARRGPKFELLSELNAVLDWVEGTEARVWGDPVLGSRGVYAKSEAPGTGAWVRIGPLPETDITRTLRVPEGDYIQAFPDRATRAGTVPIFDGAGDPAVGPTAIDIQNAQQNAADALTAKEAAETAQAAAASAAASVQVVAQRDPRYHGAIGTGVARPLSADFATLAEAQAVYPDAVALTDETDWAAIMKMIGLGQKIYMEGGIYRINRQILIDRVNDVFWDGDSRSKLLPDMNVFSNDTRASQLGTSACVIKAQGELSGGFVPITGLRIGGFVVDGQSIDQRRSTVLALLNANSPEVSHIEAYGFAVGTTVYADGLNGGRIRHIKTHDWYSDHVYADIPTAQATAISLDDGEINGGRSKGVEVAFTQTTDLVKGATHVATHGQQTDCVNLQHHTSKEHWLHHNYGRAVDEGCDVFGAYCRIEDNEFVDMHGAGVKLIHGANNNYVCRNRIVNCAFWAITLRATSAGGDVHSNYIVDNRIDGLQAGAVACLDTGDNVGEFSCLLNYSSGNYFNPGSGGACIRAQLDGSNGRIFSDGDIFIAPGTNGYVEGVSSRVFITSPQRKTLVRARLGSAQVIDQTAQKIDFSDLAFDLRSEWDAGNQRWGGGLHGDYRISFAVRTNSAPASNLCTMDMRVAGVSVCQKQETLSASGDHTFEMAVQVPAAELAHFEAWLLFATAPSFTLSQDSTLSWLTIEMV